MALETPEDVWAIGEDLELYVGRWSRLVAVEFLGWIAVPPNRSRLDIGTGTGAVSETILHRCAPESLLGVDSSQGYVAYANSRITDKRADFRTGDATGLSFSDGGFDAAVSGLVINFLPDMERAVAEFRRVVKTGGTVAAYVWDYAGEIQFMRYFWDAAVALDPAALELDEGRRFPVCRPGPLADLFSGAGLSEVETRAIDAPTVFRDFDDYWTPFLGGQGPAPGYCMSLSAERREALRQKVKADLPLEQDGSISLIARAWAVKGTVL